MHLYWQHVELFSVVVRLLYIHVLALGLGDAHVHLSIPCHFLPKYYDLYLIYI
eukprot:m.14620 g.14620  ORF g.14620 m.14620 type:complete len:53 (-) comp7651_c0_seq1:135-293(-)